MSTAIWTKDKLDRYWLLQQRARALGMRLTGEGQGSPTIRLHMGDRSGEGILQYEFDDLDQADSLLGRIETDRASRLEDMGATE